MKFMMIFEGVDRATKTLNKIMAADRKAAATIKAGAAGSEKATNAAAAAIRAEAGALSKMQVAAQRAFAAVRAGAKAAGNAVTNLHNKTIALGRSGLSNIGDGSSKVFKGMSVAAGIAASALGGAALAAGSLVGVASRFQKFQTILETTEGSSAKAKTAMDWVSKFATKTPYELEEVMNSFVQLRARGLDPTNGLMEMLGDTSAAMGVPLMQGVEAMADAVTGESERLKEFGIVASKIGNKISYSYTNAAGKQMEASVKANDRMAIQMKLMDIMGEKYGGAMLKLSGTWDGMIGNLMDLWSGFQLSIMKAGLFDWMEGKLQSILDSLNRMKADGTLDAWAKTISDNIIWVLDSAWDFGVKLWGIFEKLAGYLKSAATYVGGWENLAMVLAGIAFAPTLITTAAGLVQIATGLTALTAALMANPIVLIIGAIALGAAAIYMNWTPIAAFFIDIWRRIANAATESWNKVKTKASEAWASVKGTVQKAISAIPGIVSEAWERIKTTFAWHPAIIIVQNWGAIQSAAKDAVNAALVVVEEVWNRVKALFDWSPIAAIEAAWAGISDKVGGFINDAAKRAGQAWEKVKSVFSFGDETSVPTAPAMPDPVVIQADVDEALAKLSALDAAAQKIMPSVSEAVGKAQTFLASVSFYDQGAALMETMAAGMRARASVVIQEIQRMTQQVRDHLPSSPAKTGPLSDIHRLKFGETIAASIRAEPMVRAMRAASAATMAAASIASPAAASADVARAQIAQATVNSASSSNGPTAPQQAAKPFVYSPTFHWNGGATAKDKDDFAKMLNEHGREVARVVEEQQRRDGRREF